MAIPNWLRTVGKIALKMLVEYGTPPAPVTPPASVVPFPTPPSAPAQEAAPPANQIPRNLKDPFVWDTYRLAKPEGMNRYPDDNEWFSDSENVAKYGREWLRKNMYERNGAPYPGAV